MNVITPHSLVDVPISLATARQERIQKVTAGAAAVLADRSYTSNTGAIRTLRNLGWSTYEAMILIDDIRQVAVQHVVAMEMSEP